MKHALHMYGWGGGQKGCNLMKKMGGKGWKKCERFTTWKLPIRELPYSLSHKPSIWMYMKRERDRKHHTDWFNGGGQTMGCWKGWKCVKRGRVEKGWEEIVADSIPICRICKSVCVVWSSSSWPESKGWKLIRWPWKFIDAPQQIQLLPDVDLLSMISAW